MAAPIHVKGLDELQRFLDQLPAKVERNVLRGALRAGMNTIKPAAQEGINSVSGETAKGLKVGTKTRGGEVIANLKATGPHAFIAHMLEFTGAKAHIITPAVKRALSLGGATVASVEHPGFRPRPFMRPAMDSQAAAAVVAAGEYMRTRLATKHGLDTADIDIEVTG